MARSSRVPVPSSPGVTYQWGAEGGLSGGQDLVSQFRPVFQPDLGIFSPSYPLVPTDPERVRTWDFPVGYNFIYTPRSYEAVSFEELQALADNHDLTRMAIETRKDQIEKLDWEIRLRNDKDKAAASDKRIEMLTDFWRFPDGKRPFGTWLRSSLEDLLVLDAPAFEVRRNRGGDLLGLDVVDGSTIKILIDVTGRIPLPPAPAYEQIIHGRPWRLLTTDELLYYPRNQRPNRVYGFPPVEQIIMTINTGIRRQIMQLQHFTESNIPAGMINAPEGWNKDQIAEFQSWFNSILQGNTANRVSIVWTPEGAKYQAFKEAPFKDEFDEWLARIVMFCFSLPPDAFIRQRNRATAETARQTALEEGLAPLMGWVKRLIDHVIQVRMGHKDLEFQWQEIKQVDPQIQAQTIDQYLRNGTYTLNEARDQLGLDPLGPEGDTNLVYLGAQPPVTLDSILNPPEPPPQLTAPGIGTASPGTGGPGNPPRQRPAEQKKPGEEAQGERKVPVEPTEVGKAANGSSSDQGGAGPQPALDAAGRNAIAREAVQLLRLARRERRSPDSGRAAA